jgi:hypothetical protein
MIVTIAKKEPIVVDSDALRVTLSHEDFCCESAAQAYGSGHLALRADGGAVVLNVNPTILPVKFCPFCSQPVRIHDLTK